MRQGFIHIAFSVGSKENVDTITRQLEADGYTEVFVIHDILVVSLACAGIARVFARLINGKELLCRNYERLAVFVSNNHVLF